VAKLSYDVLPGTWREWDRESFQGLQSTLGYYKVTQENAPRDQTYWANVNSGPLDARTPNAVRPNASSPPNAPVAKAPCVTPPDVLRA